MGKISTFDVAKYYDEVVATNIEKNTKEYLDNLFKVDIDKEKLSSLNNAINDNQNKINQENKSFVKSKWFFFLMQVINFFTVISTILAVLYIAGIFNNFLNNNSSYRPLFIVVIVIAVICCLFEIGLRIYKSKKIKEIKAIVDPLTDKLNKDIYSARKILSPITNKFNRVHAYDLLEKSFKELKLKTQFTDLDVNYFQENVTTNENESSFSMICGNTFTNPFLFHTKKIFRMGEKTWTGTTTKSFYVNGEWETVVITAQLTKPHPYYNNLSVFNLASNNFNDLEFKFEKSFKHENEVKHFYKKHPNQRRMENSEFDRLFPAVRNDEILFRSLFTIYTQEEMVHNAERFKFINNLTYFKNTGKLFQIHMDSDINNLAIAFNANSFNQTDVNSLYSDYTNTLKQTMFSLYQYMSPLFSSSIIQQEIFLPVKTYKKYQYLNNLNLEHFLNSNANHIKFLHGATSNAMYDGLVKFELLENKKTYETYLMHVSSYGANQKTEEVMGYGGGHSALVPVTYLEFYPLVNTFPAIYTTIDENLDLTSYLTDIEPHPIVSKYKLLALVVSCYQVLIILQDKKQLQQLDITSVINEIKHSFKK
ncbi:hypothetical protein MGM1_2760 [Candidatus Malacoplasma girerdii]|uniref:Uncharacterized protein n=1 Tax=Candidatus Malacoplasma girerdii TaxID=1318617 RepID=A0A097SSU2_9BACT|nr:hypothetical protein MGM1_2760 [Candidatus Malacoplasma girerdii]